MAAEALLHPAHPAWSAPPESVSSRPLTVTLATRPAEIKEAQRLRYEIFSRELGAALPGGRGLDEDRFDPFCDHLLVRDQTNGRLVGCTRLLTQEQALAAGSFYTETEFDLRAVLRLPGRFLEVGRTCIHPDYRRGAAIAVLWSGIAPVLLERGYSYLIGCASISLAAGVAPVRSLIRDIQSRHLTPAEHRVVPLRPLPNMLRHSDVLPCPAPALIKAYLRLGAMVCGDAAWDPEFKTADLVILLERRRLDARYARHFLKAS